MADDRTCVASFFRLFRPRRSSWKLGRKKQTPLSLSLSKNAHKLTGSPGRQLLGAPYRKANGRRGRAEGGRESGRREGEREEEGRAGGGRESGREGGSERENWKVNQRAKGERN